MNALHIGSSPHLTFRELQQFALRPSLMPVMRTYGYVSPLLKSRHINARFHNPRVHPATLKTHRAHVRWKT